MTIKYVFKSDTEKKEKKKIKEGVWALSKNDHDYDKAIKELEAFTKKYFSIIGDDELYNNIDKAVARIKLLKKHKDAQK